ncbi:serine/arginine repetitive matrix protein 1-like [Drosophila suzukii]|uniref:Serine/arginine repetitive matrix protein 1-like n=1 Tax=Drosophila suzukii TaxID=28584 RepID=A0ABM4TXH2_DROSZ
MHGDDSLEVVLKMEANVRIRTPIRALPLADERFPRPATISLILGADVYPKVIQPGFHIVDEGLPHSTGSCQSGDRCRTCNRNHHTLLHMHDLVSRKKSGSKQRSRSKQQPASPQRSRRQDPPTRQTPAPPPRSASSTPAPSLAAVLQRHSVNVRPTAVAVGTAALIDPCTPTSSIDASLAAAESVVQKFQELPLADGRPATVSLILGADVYPGFHMVDEGLPEAQKTVFGKMAPRPRSAQALDSRRTRGTQSYRCRVCRGINPLRKCQRFLKLSAEKRLRAVLINKCCANCLAHEHSTGSCRSGDRCRTCNRNHHTLLHMHDLVSRKKSGSKQKSRSKQQPASPQRSRRQDPPTRQTPAPPPRSASSTPAPSLAALLQRHSVNVLPTAVASVRPDKLHRCIPGRRVSFADKKRGR